MKKILLTAALALSIGLTETTAQQLVDQRFVGRYSTGIFDESATEIAAFDPATNRLFSVNGLSGMIDILDISNPSNPVYTSSIDLSLYGGGANSIDFHNGVLAIAVQAFTKTDSGSVVFLNGNGSFLNSVTVGALPDMLTFTDDGKFVLVACEGEPNSDYSIDPEGNVAIIELPNNITTLSQSNVTLLNFSAYNATGVAGVRVYGPNATFAQDMEPEYIAVAPNGKTAWVSLQENNALAEINIPLKQINWVRPLGFKNHMLPGNGIDASDRNSGIINIANWPVFGMYQPDAIGAYNYQGKTYIVSANEGDARDYDTFDEMSRVKDLDLDETAFPNAAELQSDNNLGRLNVTTTLGDTDGDGDFDELYCLGGRSFSIWDNEGQLVFDSGDFLERYIETNMPDQFNYSSTNNTKQNRSDDKGPEPEGLTIANILGKNYLFLGLERIGGVMVFDITNPASPSFVDYLNTRDFSVTPGANYPTDLGPEGLLFIPASDSPNGKNLLAVSSETSGSIALFETDYSCGNNKAIVCYNNNSICVNTAILNNYLNMGAILGECQSASRTSVIATDRAFITSVYPNPASEKVILSLKNVSIGTYDIRITDINGRLISNLSTLVDGSYDDFGIEIDLNGYSSGMYQYTVSDRTEKTHSGTIVVE